MIQRIDSIEKLSEYFPLIVFLFKKSPNIFLPAKTPEEYIQRVISLFCQNDSMIFGKITRGKVDFFLVCSPYEDNTSLWVDLCYSDPRQYNKTLSRIEQCKTYTMAKGIKTWYWQTTRLTRSFRRFMLKLNAKPFIITYKLK